MQYYREFKISSLQVAYEQNVLISQPSYNYFADDHNRVLLKETASATGSDYINASYVVSVYYSTVSLVFH